MPWPTYGHLAGAVPHEVAGQAGVRGGGQRGLPHGAAGRAGPGRGRRRLLHAQGGVVGPQQLGVQRAQRVHAREVRHVAVAHGHEVEDHRLAAADAPEARALRDRRAEAGAGQRRVEVARHAAAHAGEQLAVEHLLVEAAHADVALVAQAPRLRLHAAGELDLGEPLLEQARDEAADLVGDGRRGADALDLPRRLDRPLPHDGRGRRPRTPPPGTASRGGGTAPPAARRARGRVAPAGRRTARRRGAAGPGRRQVDDRRRAPTPGGRARRPCARTASPRPRPARTGTTAGPCRRSSRGRRSAGGGRRRGRGPPAPACRPARRAASSVAGAERGARLHQSLLPARPHGVRAVKVSHATR